MALIRVTGHFELPGETLAERDLILNTEHIVFATPSHTSGSQDSHVHLIDGETIRVNMPFDEFWMLIQRET